MKKIIIGIVIGLGLTAGSVYASTTISSFTKMNLVSKFQDGNVTCYVLGTTGISCFTGVQVVAPQVVADTPVTHISNHSTLPDNNGSRTVINTPAQARISWPNGIK